MSAAAGEGIVFLALGPDGNALRETAKRLL